MMRTYTQKLSVELLEDLNSELAVSRFKRPNLSRSMLVRELLSEAITHRRELRQEQQPEQQPEQQQESDSQSGAIQLLRLTLEHMLKEQEQNHS